MTRLVPKISAAIGIALVMATLAAAPAEARRGGSFGSRGMRTYSAPRATPTAPNYTAPVSRSMTPGTPGLGQAAAPRPNPAPGLQQPQPQRRGGMFGGFGGGLLGGLVAGGLLGAMLGHGWGGAGFGAGMMQTLIQVALFGLIAFGLIAFFRRRREQSQPQAAGYAGAGYGGNVAPFEPAASSPLGPRWQQQQQMQGGYAAPVEPQPQMYDIELTQADRSAFERLLTEVQDAFGREDYGALRQRTTPEIMSYLSEELSQNAVNGRKNQVSDLRLLQADVSEAWSEDAEDYATAAMRYESIDVMRDRTTGQVVEGDPAKPTETVELWTFVRPRGGDWKLSAIQQA